MKRLLVLVLLVVAAAGCGGGTSTSTSSATAACPDGWQSDWQRLADDVGSPVYCPGWMPYPLDGDIDGRYKNGRWVDSKDKSYLVSFLWVDHDAGVSREVHANLRGYPGRTTTPTCEATLSVKGKTVRKPIPCWSDPRGTRKLGDITATVYSVAQGIDAWHVLYEWTKDGTLYTISEHVTPPYTFEQVQRNLDRMAKHLVIIEPNA